MKAISLLPMFLIACVLGCGAGERSNEQGIETPTTKVVGQKKVDKQTSALAKKPMPKRPMGVPRDPAALSIKRTTLTLSLQSERWKRLQDEDGKRKNSNRIELSPQESIVQIVDLINETATYKPTFVAWCVDQTESASELSKSAVAEIKNQFRESEKKLSGQLSMAVYGFGRSVKRLNRTPIESSTELNEALAKLSKASGGVENGLQALSLAAEQRTKTPAESTIFVLITDEAPSDPERLETVIQSLLAKKIAVYVIGYPAPFGQVTVKTRQATEESSVTYGPETVMLERLKMDFGDKKQKRVSRWIDSGFGPWTYERLCRKTGGQFIAIRPAFQDQFSSSLRKFWPYAAKQFSLSAMTEYPPDYRSRDQYMKDSDANQAIKSLHQVAQTGKSRYNILAPPRIRASDDEARMAKAILEIQELIAAGTATVKPIYDTLKAGSVDRAKLTNLRWQASFDLAYGRAAANYIRLEGANAMLAKAKSGMNFKNSENNTWILQPSKTINSGGLHRRIAEQAKQALQEIIDNHPRTPWALLAESELSSPLGWEWTETKE